MAAGAVYRRPGETQENAEARRDASSLHERLVAYVHTLEHGSRRGVLGEHSYARARQAGGRGAPSPGGRARALLAPPALLPEPALVDVTTPGSPPPAPPDLTAPRVPYPAEEEDVADEEEWEARLVSAAPGAHHARLAAGVLRALRHLRLQRLVGGGGAWRAREEVRAAAGSVRRALAPAWLCGGAVPWLASALTAHMPRSARRLYEEVVRELRRAVPRLAERLTGEWAPPPPPDPPLPRAAPVSPDSDPWLVWVSSGCAALDARWERRLAALVHTRVLRAPRGEAAPPEPWCAAAAGALRAQLTDALAEAGDRSIILGGVGAGAALCVLLARGAGGAGDAAGGVRGAVLCAPPLRSAEGRDEGLRAARLPLLLVVGTRAHNADRAAAHELAVAGGVGEGARRVLEVHGADCQLRIPRRMRARLNLPQHALDAALVEECVRWAIETAEGAEPPPSPPVLDMTISLSPSTAPALAPAPAPPARRHPLPSIVHHIDLDPEDEYAHLPAAAPPATAPATAPFDTSQSPRSIEIVEGRVVARTAGGTPLPLPPPRPRRAAPPARRPPTPSLADIMQMPIVFADDNATDSSPTGSPVTVTSGKARGGSGSGSGSGASPVKMTRVILAKRASGGAGGGGPRPLPPDVVTVRPARPAAVSVRPARGSSVSVRPARGSAVSVRPARAAVVSVRPARPVAMSVRGAHGPLAAPPRRVMVRRPLRVLPAAPPPGPRQHTP